SPRLLAGPTAAPAGPPGPAAPRAALAQPIARAALSVVRAAGRRAAGRTARLMTVPVTGSMKSSPGKGS
ncbi:chitin-binding protein, partial [Streptomyces erythrochromogenes]